MGLVPFPQIAIQHMYFKACVLQSLYSRQGESLSGVGDQKTKPLQWKYTLGGKGAAQTFRKAIYVKTAGICGSKGMI